MEAKGTEAVIPVGLPRWVWAISAVLFPLGPFLALAAAKALSWPRAVGYAILSYAPMAAMAALMMHFQDEGRPDNDPLRMGVLLTGWACYIAIGWAQYRIGKRAACWSPVGRRVWRIIGITACILLAIDVGGLVGWWAWPRIASAAVYVLGAHYRGLPSVLLGFCSAIGAVLGAITAGAFVLRVWGLRRTAGWILLVVAVVAITGGARLAWDMVRSEGSRLAIAVYGLPMLWAALLGAWGWRMRRPAKLTAECPIAEQPTPNDSREPQAKA